jgi:hypothetical protein
VTSDNGRVVTVSVHTKLSDFRGKAVLLNFWTTSCRQCDSEIPWFQEFQQTYRDGPVVLGVSLDKDGWVSARPYVEGRKINYRVMVGGDEARRWLQVHTHDAHHRQVRPDRGDAQGILQQGRIPSRHAGASRRTLNSVSQEMTTMNNRRIVVIVISSAALLAPLTSAPIIADGQADTVQTRAVVTGGQDARSAPTVAKITLANGSSRTVSLEGVGCSETLCSRVAVRSRIDGDAHVQRTRLDSLVAIRDITKDGARFVFKDGTERRLSVVAENRVLYVVNQNGDETRIDLARIASVEFQRAARSER